jgi:hypothetical protein
MRALLLLCLITPACSTDLDDDLAGEDHDLGAPGKADAAGTEYTYWTVAANSRGYEVARVNRQGSPCVGGETAPTCPVDVIDWSESGLSESEVAEADVAAALAEGRVLLRGRIAGGAAEQGAVRFLAEEVWVGTGEPLGVFARVRDNGVRCISWPCATMTETKLNSALAADIAELDFGAGGASDDDAAAALEATFASDGLIVAGYRYTVSGPSGRAKARTAFAFFTRVTAQD